MSNCEKIYHSIAINNEIEIDCFQNLLLSYLEYYGMNADELKFVWPYAFVKKEADENKWRIEHDDAISIERIRKYYNAKCEMKYFDNNERKIDIIRELLKKDQAVFVCIDEYYVPYHYNYIYLNQHGVHTVLVTKIDEENNLVQLVSSIPYFKGEITLDCFLNALESMQVNQWYCVLDENSFINPEKYVLDVYKREIVMSTEKVDKIILTEDILLYILDLKEENRAKNISELCKGTWGWKITKKGELLIEYIKNNYSRSPQLKEIVELIERLNSEWTRAYKLMYKSIISKKDEDLNKAINYLREECENEKILREKLLILIGEEKVYE